MNEQIVPKELIEIAKEMAVQHNCSTHNPVWMVFEDVQVRADPYDAPNKERIDDDCLDEHDLCEVCLELHEAGELMPDDCDDCNNDAFFHFSIERQPALMPGTFLTMKGCQRHIDQNDYHYKNPRPYAIPTWRNPEMDMVRDFLLSLVSGMQVSEEI